MRESRTRGRAKVLPPHLSLLAASLVLWATLARANPPTALLGIALRPSEELVSDPLSDEPPQDPRLEVRLLIARPIFVAEDMGILLPRFFHGPFDLRPKDWFAEIERALRIETIEPLSARFGGEPFERKGFDFQRKCLNPCPLGGWGACVLDTRPAQDECQSIVGRSLMSSAARRAPMVREVLRLMGSQATRLPTDVDRSLRLSTMLVSGGGTLGIEARW